MQLEKRFSVIGLLVGTLFFALSLTPSLLPRTNLVQGVLSGLSMSAGYGVGILGIWLWTFFELPRPKRQVRLAMQLAAAGACLLIAAVFLWQASSWQNSLRMLMGMGEGPGIQPLVIGAIAFAVFFLVLYISRLFLRTFRFLSGKLQRYVPRRVSYVAGWTAAFLLFWSVADGILFSVILRSADATYRQVDAAMEPEFERPADPLKTGSGESLLAWEDMGREGRRFLAEAPGPEDLAAFTGLPVLEPVRVYAGMHAAETSDERARLTLEELKRVNAFERSLLVLITPTGTGWVDPASIEPLEYLHRGDIASVAAQYSYLPSALSLLFEDDYGEEMARALFREVYGYWTELPAAERPRLYLHGLSLGALNSDRSFDLFDIIHDPFEGVLWVGPPFRKDTWHSVTSQRNPSTPEWLPEFRDGSVVRFANQQGGLEEAAAPWGSFRIAYLQYASDPVTFFNPQAFTRRPDWMREPRGPDVSDDLRWFPVVTMLQLAADMIGGTTPRGFGHEFAAEHYFDAWHALTEPEDWSPQELSRLRSFFSENHRDKSSR